jgi:hypothetical protein
MLIQELHRSALPLNSQWRLRVWWFGTETGNQLRVRQVLVAQVREILSDLAVGNALAATGKGGPCEPKSSKSRTENCGSTCGMEVNPHRQRPHVIHRGHSGMSTQVSRLLCVRRHAFGGLHQSPT